MAASRGATARVAVREAHMRKGGVRKVTGERGRVLLAPPDIFSSRGTAYLPGLPQGHDDLLEAMYHEVVQPALRGGPQGGPLAQGVRGLSRREASALRHRMGRMELRARNILLARRLQKGPVALDWQEVDLARVLEGVAVGYCEHYGQRRIACLVERGLPRVLGDQAKVEQVMDTLLDIAVQYSQKRSGVIIAARSGSAPEGVGAPGVPGISLGVYFQAEEILAADLEDLFQRAGRDGDLLSPSTPGLGFYLCRGVIMAHGGKIEVKRWLGTGVTVLLWLPLAGGPQQLRLWGSNLPKGT